MRYPGYEQARRNEKSKPRRPSFISQFHELLTQNNEDPVQDVPPSTGTWMDEETEMQVRSSLDKFFGQKLTPSYTLTKSSDGDVVTFSGYTPDTQASIRIRPVEQDGRIQFEVTAEVAVGPSYTGRGMDSEGPIVLPPTALTSLKFTKMLADAQDKARAQQVRYKAEQ